MNLTEIKKELHEYIDSANENLLKAIYDMLRSADDKDDFIMSDEHKRILDERLKAYYINPTDVITWEDLKVKIEKMQ